MVECASSLQYDNCRGSFGLEVVLVDAGLCALPFEHVLLIIGVCLVCTVIGCYSSCHHHCYGNSNFLTIMTFLTCRIMMIGDVNVVGRVSQLQPLGAMLIVLLVTY